jgi:anthraniloyl-CoA monooxygenase
MNFPRVVCGKWYHQNVVLMGDAAATGHFSIGSGTRLALDSAIALAEYLQSEPTLEAAFQRYQDERRVEVLRLQSAARNSLEWFEQVERYLDLPPEQFAYSLLTRSQRISHENLRLRDPEWLGRAEDWFQAQAGGQAGRKPMFAPFRLRDMTLKNRIVVSPMAQYKAVDGCPTDWHLVHLGERAKGGAGLVYTEMTCTSARAASPPAARAFMRRNMRRPGRASSISSMPRRTAKICCQIGHAGRKASTQLGWEEGDAPLPAGNWEIIGPRPCHGHPGTPSRAR